MPVSPASARLAVDIGGTFTDLALEVGGRLLSTKTLTTAGSPEQGVLTGIAEILGEAGLAPAQIGLIIHGTTLATNALIERKGARTALVVTEGLRDSVEMAYENRFEQYDLEAERPQPLVPRRLRLPVRERLSAAGEVLVPLDERGVAELVPTLEREGIESIAVGLIHAYANPAHEQRVGAVLARALPGVPISLSSAVCPEIREYERQSTTCANAYVQPLMGRYLRRLEEALSARGFDCPFYMMTSGGGLCTLEAAIAFPIRLVESGPAGGAILAARVAAELDLGAVVAYDMGGTTAKLCLIDEATPPTSRSFEVDRVYHAMKGSGLPVRIPVIEMVEIGAGGGSIAHLDAMRRIAVGPRSAGSEPGPACYARGGTEPTVTDADLAMGRIDPETFAGGAFALDPARAHEALRRAIGEALDLGAPLAAFGVSEIVDENMAGAARVHAVESGRDISARVLIAYGGAAPLHAARLAEKLGIARVVIPTDAGVGSAVGFLRAPIAHEVVRSRYQRLSAFDPGSANAALGEMQAEARTIVAPGARGRELIEERQAFMRYAGQGHEVVVAVPVRELGPPDEALLRERFDATYTRLYGRTIPGLDIEILSWTLGLRTREAPPARAGTVAREHRPVEALARRAVFDPARGLEVEAAVHRRSDLPPGAWVPGPALITEAQTTTVVSSRFDATVGALGYIILERKPEGASDAA